MVITSETPLAESETVELEELLGECITFWSVDRGIIMDLNPNQVRRLLMALRADGSKRR